MDTLLLIKGVIILLIFGITLLIATYSTYAERKVAAFLQDRIGPNRAGIFGLLQPIADAGKMFFKEDFIPANSNKWLFILGPSAAMMAATMTSAVIPFGGQMELFGEKFYVQGIDANIGVLYVFAVVALGVYGIMIGGWASNNKFSLLGAIRAASQNISYELAMGLSIISIVMMVGSLSLRDIVTVQESSLYGLSFMPSGTNWFLFYQPLGFIIFITCAFAECNRTPFDLPECETELIGGYHTEYSSMKLGFYLFAEYINMFISSVIISILFFGGYNYPFMAWVTENAGQNIATLIGVGALFAKALFFVFFFMWVRWTLPRFRYDQLMNLGWKTLLPLAILNVMITGVVILVLKG
ncbi:NADH:ubiquinone oxidoreductase subunit H [bacterium 336/3]|jgi:NADH-quinone oxidoreductase subunit H|nr:NADH:ubiquinone oxidoreductase subunit H [bacterium 336/3]